MLAAIPGKILFAFHATLDQNDFFLKKINIKEREILNHFMHLKSFQTGIDSIIDCLLYPIAVLFDQYYCHINHT